MKTAGSLPCLSTFIQASGDTPSANPDRVREVMLYSESSAVLNYAYARFIPRSILHIHHPRWLGTGGFICPRSHSQSLVSGQSDWFFVANLDKDWAVLHCQLVSGQFDSFFNSVSIYTINEGFVQIETSGIVSFGRTLSRSSLYLFF